MGFHGLSRVLDAFRSLRGPKPGVMATAQKVKTLLEQDDRKTASHILIDGLQRFPGHSSLEDINHFVGQKRLQDCLAMTRRAEEEALKSHVRTARAFADTDNHKKAIDFITTAIRRFPQCADLHLILGEMYLNRYLEDKIPDDGRYAAESIERAFRLDHNSPLPRKYLAGFYARIGCFREAVDYLSKLDGKGLSEDEQRYIEELRNYCASRAAGETASDLETCLGHVWEHGEFVVDCRNWGVPRRPLFEHRDLKSVVAPFVVLETVASGCVELPGVKAIVVQNEVRSETMTPEGTEVDRASLENVVRSVAEKSTEACHHMRLGHVNHCEMKTTAGRLSLQTFSDTWVGFLFENGVRSTQVRTVTQQFIDLVAERLGEINESNS